MRKKKDRSRFRREEQIYLAFSELVKEKNFDAITVCDICKASGVQRATFYGYYTDKFDFFDKYVTHIRQPFAEKLKSSEIKTMSDFINQIINNSFEVLTKNVDLIKAIASSDTTILLYDICVNQVRVDMQEFIKKMDKDCIDPSFDTEYYLGAFFNSFKWYIENRNRVTPEEFKRMLSRQVCKGSISEK